MFRKSVRDCVNRELPKSWARELEKDEHTFPHELFGQADRRRLPRDRHRRGVRRPGRRHRDPDAARPRDLARSLAGLSWVWGDHVVRRREVSRHLRHEEQKQRFLPAIAARRAALLDRLHRAGRRHRRARRRCARSPSGSTAAGSSTATRRGAHPPTSPTTSCCSPGPTRDVAKRHQGVSLFLLPTDADGVTISRDPEARHARARLLRRRSGRRVRARRAACSASRARPGTCCCRRSTTSASCCRRSASGSSTAFSRTRCAYVQEREAFGKQIGEFQILQHYIADIAMWQRAGGADGLPTPPGCSRGGYPATWRRRWPR